MRDAEMPVMTIAGGIPKEKGFIYLTTVRRKVENSWQKILDSLD